MTRRFLVAAAVLAIVGVAAVIVVSSRGDGATDFSDPQELVDRLERADIGGCRVEDDRTTGCFDVAGVAYFRASLLDQEMSADQVLARACDESTSVALFIDGQNWFGRVRAHPERASLLAAALASAAIPCERTETASP